LTGTLITAVSVGSTIIGVKVDVGVLRLIDVGVEVKVEVDVAVASSVAVLVASVVGVEVGVSTSSVGVSDGVVVAVGVSVGVSVAVAVAVGVAVGVEVLVAVFEGVSVNVAVGVFVAVLVGDAITVGVAVGVLVGVDADTSQSFSKMAIPASFQFRPAKLSWAGMMSPHWSPLCGAGYVTFTSNTGPVCSVWSPCPWSLPVSPSTESGSTVSVTYGFVVELVR
jgi:hypothetical protein